MSSSSSLFFVRIVSLFLEAEKPLTPLQKISTAEGYATKRINEAEGDANRFEALLTEFKKAPEVTKKRIYLETMSEILPGVPNKVILDEKAPQFLPLMNLNSSAK